MTLARLLTVSLLLAGCDGGDSAKPPGVWQIGPVINGNNYSKDCPRSFKESFTTRPCEPHYVTKPGSKVPTSLTFTLDGEVEGVKCNPATISLYFETNYNDWRTDGQRWWSGTIPLTPGTHTLQPGKWTSVLTMTEDTHPQEFARAKANIARVGFTFGDCTGLGHGARALAPASFVIADFGAR